jgi:hypothetical protein
LTPSLSSSKADSGHTPQRVSGDQVCTRAGWPLGLSLLGAQSRGCQGQESDWQLSLRDALTSVTIPIRRHNAGALKLPVGSSRTSEHRVGQGSSPGSFGTFILHK